MERISRLPGLRGFSEHNLKNMRTFYEEWQLLDANPAVTTAEVQANVIMIEAFKMPHVC